MVNRFFVLALAMGILGAMLVGPALSEGPPPHAHLLITGLDFDEVEDQPLGWKKCRALANGQPVPNNAHHAHMHTGRAGEAQWQAGNAVVPTAPLAPWNSCAQLEEFFFGE